MQLLEVKLALHMELTSVWRVLLPISAAMFVYERKSCS